MRRYWIRVVLVIVGISVAWIGVDTQFLFGKYTNSKDYIISKDVRIVHGNTIILNNIHIRLQGIDPL